VVGFKLSLIFIAALLFDGLILPAFFGFRNSFLSLLILIVPILYIGSTRQSIVYGLAFSFISESLRGLDLGDLAIPFLFTAVVIYLTQPFLDIRYTYDTRFSLSKLAIIILMSVVVIYVFSFFFKQGSLNVDYFNSVAVLTIALEVLILVFVFNIVFNEKSDYQ
jgi:hypothetical protein